jgi:hypothetical protein
MPFSCQIVYGKTWERYLTKTDIARSWLAERTGYVYQHLAETYKLGKPVPLTINKDLDTPVQICVNGIDIVKPYFDGKFFTYRDISIETSGNDQVQVTGWKVEMTRGVKTTITYVDGPAYTFSMPDCDSLALAVVTGKSIGISEIPVDAHESQSTLATFDLMGRHTDKPAKGVYIVREGCQTRKMAVR